MTTRKLEVTPKNLPAALHEAKSPLDAARIAVKLGYLLIGTARSEERHKPPLNARYTLNIELGMWCLVDDPNRHLVRATSVITAATMTALMGDYNYPNQRNDLTLAPRPHYGWTVDPTQPDGILPHARPEIINKITSRGSHHKGFIDVVYPEEHCMLLDFGDIGQYGCWPTAITAHTLPVDGTYLPSNIRPIDYTPYIAKFD